MSNFFSRFSRSATHENYAPLLNQEEQQPVSSASASASASQPAAPTVADRIEQTVQSTITRVIDYNPSVENAVRAIGDAIADRKLLASTTENPHMAEHHQHVAHAMFAYNTVPRLQKLGIHVSFLNYVALEIEHQAIQFVKENHQKINEFQDKDPQAVARAFQFAKAKAIESSNTKFGVSDVLSFIPLINVGALGYTLHVDQALVHAVKADRARNE